VVPKAAPVLAVEQPQTLSWICMAVLCEVETRTLDKNVLVSTEILMESALFPAM
jgi:hypothetical protein